MIVANTDRDLRIALVFDYGKNAGSSAVTDPNRILIMNYLILKNYQKNPEESIQTVNSPYRPNESKTAERAKMSAEVTNAVTLN